jgi:putative sigma-54 modulation protein
MRITNIHAANIELTEAIRQYVTEKIEGLSRFTKKFDPCDAAIEIGKTSTHHNKGDIYFAEITVSIPGDTVRTHVEKDDLYAAIDEAKDDVKRQFVEKKEMMIDARAAVAADVAGEDIIGNDDDEDDEDSEDDDSQE